MSAKNLVPLSVRNRLPPIYYGWIKWPMPLWRLRGHGGFGLAGRRYRFVDVAKPPHDWWAWQARQGEYEPDVLTLLASQVRPGDVFFDIGVYIGVYSVVAADLVGGCGRVVSFEPDPVSQVIARRNLELNALGDRVRLVAAAVSDSTTPILLDAAHLGRSTSHRGSGTFEAQCIRLDDWCETAGIWPDVIKMDIEGAEAFALGEHARATIERARAIVLEVHEDAVREHGTEVRQILDWLASTGKELVNLESRWEGNFNVAALAPAR